MFKVAKGSSGPLRSSCASPASMRSRVPLERSCCAPSTTAVLSAYEAGRVGALDVLAHHAGGGEARGEGLEGSPHAFDPECWDPVGISVVEGRHHLGLEHAIEVRGGTRVGGSVVWVHLAGECPAVGPVICLGPPAVEDAELQAAVHHRLHPARAAGLEWGTGDIEPDVAAADECGAGGKVVVVEEDHALADGLCALQAKEALQNVLCLLVAWMRLAGQYHLDGSFAFEESESAVWVVCEQPEPLVCGDAPREPDCQDVGGKRPVGGVDV